MRHASGSRVKPEALPDGVLIESFGEYDAPCTSLPEKLTAHSPRARGIATLPGRMGALALAGAPQPEGQGSCRAVRLVAVQSLTGRDW